MDDSLKSVNLYHGGVADKRAGKYSGGMKRRLSVAISLIGDPKVKPHSLFTPFLFFRYSTFFLSSEAFDPLTCHLIHAF